jgi:CheY-like chemotaxis protein
MAMSSTGPVPRTILIVEDDPDSREMFVELLRGGGYSVIATRNGKDAMTFLAVNAPPDVILLDMFMPEMDGWQFRRTQEADARLAAIPVVVVSAVRAAANSAVRSGAAAFLQKPVAAGELLDALEKLWRAPDAPAEKPEAAGGDAASPAEEGLSPTRPV